MRGEERRGMLVPLHLRRCNRITSSRPRCIRSNLVAVGPDKLSSRRILAGDFGRTETEIRTKTVRQRQSEMRNRRNFTRYENGGETEMAVDNIRRRALMPPP